MIRHYTQERVTKTGNQWTVGNTVKVGFLRLVVLGVDAVTDGMPDIYTLASPDGSRRYEFIPHHGLTRID